MAYNTFKCNYLTPLHFKGLTGNSSDRGVKSMVAAPAVVRPLSSRSAAAYSAQTFPWTICRSVRRSVRTSVCPLQCIVEKTADRMPFGIIGRMGPGMRQVVGFGNRSTGRVLLGANLGRAIVTNGDFTAYVCDNAATRPSSQITLGELVVAVDNDDDDDVCPTDLLFGVVFDFKVFEGDADLLVVGSEEVVETSGVVGVIARMSRRVERAVHGGATAVDEVTSIAVGRERRSARDRIVCRHC